MGQIFCFDIDCDEHNVTLRIILEKMSGNIKSFISNKSPLSSEDFIKSFKSMIQTMFEIEARGFAHKNISINNLYYKSDGSNKF